MGCWDVRGAERAAGVYGVSAGSVGSERLERSERAVTAYGASGGSVGSERRERSERAAEAGRLRLFSEFSDFPTFRVCHVTIFGAP